MYEFIKKIFRFLGSTPRSNKEAAFLFTKFNIDRVKNDLQLEQKGQERGEEELPPSGADPFDEIEEKVIQIIQNEVDKANSLYKEQANLYSIEMNRLNLDLPGTIERTVLDGKTQMDIQTRNGTDWLHRKQQDVKHVNKELSDFRKKHNIDRKADYPESRILQWGIIAVLLLIEVALNGHFFQHGSEFGLMGGMIQSFLFASVNIFFGLVVGGMFFRYFYHKNYLLKAFACIVGIIYVEVIIGFNLFLAHYRDSYIQDAGTVSFQLIAEQMLSNLLAVVDVNSWLLMLLGIIFSFIAAYDAFKMDDRYPGYGGIWRKYNNICNDYTNSKFEFTEELRGIFNRINEQINQQKQDHEVRLNQYRYIVFNYRELQQEYRTYIDHLRTGANELLTLYRKANAEKREKAPAYFNTTYDLKVEMPELTLPNDGKQKQENGLEEYYRKLDDSYNENLKEYKQLQELTDIVATNGFDNEI